MLLMKWCVHTQQTGRQTDTQAHTSTHTATSQYSLPPFCLPSFLLFFIPYLKKPTLNPELFVWLFRKGFPPTLPRLAHVLLPVTPTSPKVEDSSVPRFIAHHCSSRNSPVWSYHVNVLNIIYTTIKMSYKQFVHCWLLQSLGHGLAHNKCSTHAC